MVKVAWQSYDLGDLGTLRHDDSRTPTFSSQGSPIFHLSSLDKACENGRDPNFQ